MDNLEVITTNDNSNMFELNAEIVAGTLTSNAKELKAKVEAELKNYTVEKYIDNPDAAKTDKALLNKIEKTVSDKRKEVQKAWNEPLDEFLKEMKSLEKSISDASSQLKNITDEAENKEKEIKKSQIQEFWNTLKFNVITLDRIFNPKWLNKTFSMKDIMNECNNIVDKINSELNTIKSMNDEDSEILLSFYLETLDLNATLLKADREKLKEEKIISETKEPVIEKTIQPPIVKVTEKENDPIMDYKLELHGPKSKLILIRQYMEQLGITYTKL